MVKYHYYKHCNIITAHKRSLGQGNIFEPVCHSVHRGVEYLGGYTPSGQVHSLAGTPPDRYPPGTPPAPPGTPPGWYTPQPGTPPGRYTLQAGTPSRQVHPPGRYTPRQVHPQAGTPPRQVHPQAFTPPGQVHPLAGTPPIISACWDRVNKREVRILLECILVREYCLLSHKLFVFLSIEVPV